MNDDRHAAALRTPLLLTAMGFLVTVLAVRFMAADRPRSSTGSDHSAARAEATPSSTRSRSNRIADDLLKSAIATERRLLVSVRDHRDIPLAGALVRVCGSSGNSLHTTDKDGAVSVAIPVNKGYPDAHMVECSMDGYASESIWTDARSGPSTIDVTLRPIGLIQGRILDRSGLLVSGERLERLLLATEGGDGPVRFSYVANGTWLYPSVSLLGSSGEFEFVSGEGLSGEVVFLAGREVVGASGWSYGQVDYVDLEIDADSLLGSLCSIRASVYGLERGESEFWSVRGQSETVFLSDTEYFPRYLTAQAPTEVASVWEGVVFPGTWELGLWHNEAGPLDTKCVTAVPGSVSVITFSPRDRMEVELSVLYEGQHPPKPWPASGSAVGSSAIVSLTYARDSGGLMVIEPGTVRMTASGVVLTASIPVDGNGYLVWRRSASHITGGVRGQVFVVREERDVVIRVGQFKRGQQNWIKYRIMQGDSATIVGPNASLAYADDDGWVSIQTTVPRGRYVMEIKHGSGRAQTYGIDFEDSDQADVVVR